MSHMECKCWLYVKGPAFCLWEIYHSLKNWVKEWYQFLSLNSGQKQASAPRASIVEVGCLLEVARNQTNQDSGDLCWYGRFSTERSCTCISD